MTFSIKPILTKLSVYLIFETNVFFLELRNCQNIACLNNYIVRFHKTCILGIRIYINIRSLLMELDGSYELYDLYNGIIGQVICMILPCRLRYHS